MDEVRDKARCQQCKCREWMCAQLFHPTGEQAHTTGFGGWCKSGGRFGTCMSPRIDPEMLRAALRSSPTMQKCIHLTGLQHGADRP
jgi:hypothetical protein